MASFTIQIACDNAAFSEYDTATYQSAAPELVRILKDAINKIESGTDYSFTETLRDVNGNKVGTMKFNDD